MPVFILNELLSWRALLDIIIITATLFLLYRTLIRLGTWKILAGIVLAFVVFAIASLAKLEGVSWIFKNVSQVAVLALIVIFQPEIRKILEKFVSLRRGKNVMPQHELTEIIASSLWKLASQKRGALIVFPGSELLTEKLAEGYLLNAKTSEPLLLSIFDPNSPGHDGAVMVEDNRLSRFGVRLPMSQATRLTNDFGTRHHAAMSLAETTDALIFVVSEERGIVSAFRDGEMVKMNSPTDISSEILNHQTHPDLVDFYNIKKWDRRTAMQAGSCLFLALVFWTTLASSNRQIVKKTFLLPVEYTAPSVDLMLASERIDEVKVRLTGPKSSMNDFLLSQPTVKVDLSNMVEGTQTILLTGQNLSAASDISFQGSTPEQIKVTLAKIVRTSLPVKPQLVGSLPAGMKIEKITVIPEKIQVMIIPKDTRKTVSISTTPVYLNSVAATTKIFCKVISTPDIQPITRPWPDIEVVIEIGPEK